MRRFIFLAIIIIIGVFFRFHQLGSVPNSLNWDEVSWGYNAYSILKTGHDEHDAFMPTSFQAFGDYKQPVYVYLDTIPVAIWGLDAFAVRFPSAFFGCLSILFVYLLVAELFNRHKQRYIIALITSFFFAVSPWSIQFSRVAFEANIGLAFVILGVWLFIKGIHEKRWSYLFISLVPLSISSYTYHSEKIFTPLLVVGLLVYGFSFLYKRKNLAIILLLIYAFLNIFWVLDARTTARGRSVLFTSQQTQLLAKPTQEIITDEQQHDPLGKIFHNRRIVYSDTYLENYLLHFDPNYLFLKGNDPTHHAPGMGELYLFSLPFILIGIIILLRRYRRESALIFYWFLLGPVAAALAIDAPNASRSMIILPTWQIFIAVALFYVFTRLYSIYATVAKVLIVILFAANIFYYYHMYFYHTNSEYGQYWQYGYQQAIQAAEPYVQHGKKVFISETFEQPYIFYLFYTKYDPAMYLVKGGSKDITQKCFSIGNIYFGDCISLMHSGDIAIRTYKDDMSTFRTIRTIKYLDGTEAVRVSKYAPKKSPSS